MLILGVGNAFRGDDVAGLLAVRRLRDRLPASIRLTERHGDLVGILDDWVGHDTVILIDAMQSGAPVGTVLRVDARTERLPTDAFRSSTRAFGVAEAFALGRLLRVLPRRLVVYGIEGDDFTMGASVSEAVERAVDEVVGRVREEAARPLSFVHEGPVV
jgi:hydrogenase maturation protease